MEKPLSTPNPPPTLILAILKAQLTSTHLKILALVQTTPKVSVSPPGQWRHKSVSLFNPRTDGRMSGKVEG